MMTRTVDLVSPANAPAEALWSVISDFAGFLKWAGDGEIQIEGAGIGMIRHLRMSVGEISEKLISLDTDSRTLVYELVAGNPLGMDCYRAQIQVCEIDHTHSELIWHGEFEAIAEGDSDQIEQQLAITYEGMTQALVAYVMQ